jgi:hypothetical protein
MNFAERFESRLKYISGIQGMENSGSFNNCALPLKIKIIFDQNAWWKIDNISRRESTQKKNWVQKIIK